MNQAGWFENWWDFGLWASTIGLGCVVIWECIFLLVGFDKIIGWFIKIF